MSRPLRPFMPGVVFHVTTRIQGGEPLLEPIRGTVAALVKRYARLAQVRVAAFVIMPNHLHILAQQGPRPLATFMQPLLTCVAAAVRSASGRSGHVFAARYFAKPCLDPEYLRVAIAYAHLNPVRARLCERAADYRWSSERRFLGLDRGADEPSTLLCTELLHIFSRREGESAVELRRAYEDFCAYCLSRDRAGETGRRPVQPPPPLAGDAFWNSTFAAAATSAADHARNSSRTSRPPLDALARRAAGEIPVERVRWAVGDKAVRHARKRLIRLAFEYGFSQVRIAAYLNISPSTVNRIIRVPAPAGRS